MRLFFLECKRILKTRRSLVLGLFMLLFTLFMAYMPTTYLVSITPDEERLTGLDKASPVPSHRRKSKTPSPPSRTFTPATTPRPPSICRMRPTPKSMLCSHC